MAEEPRRFGSYLMPKLDPLEGNIEDRRGQMPGVPPPLGRFRGKPVAPREGPFSDPRRARVPVEGQPAGNLENDLGLQALKEQEAQRLLKAFREKMERLPPPDMPMRKPGE